MVILNNQYFLSQLSISSWNINGIFQRINSFRYNKLNDVYVREMLVQHKVFGLIETHQTSKEIADLNCFPEYKCFSTCRPVNDKKKRVKPSGGIALFIHKSIRKGVIKVPHSGTETLWIKFKKEFFGLTNDIFVCFAYCVPSTSSVLGDSFMPEDVYESLNNQIIEYEARGEVILLGDLNTRTLTLPDYIANEDNTLIPTPPS